MMGRPMKVFPFFNGCIKQYETKEIIEVYF